MYVSKLNSYFPSFLLLIGVPPVDVEVASGEHHSLTSPQPLVAGESSSRVKPVIGCPDVGRQALHYPPPAIYCPPLGES